jgi:hypothetical protein
MSDTASGAAVVTWVFACADWLVVEDPHAAKVAEKSRTLSAPAPILDNIFVSFTNKRPIDALSFN